MKYLALALLPVFFIKEKILFLIDPLGTIISRTQEKLEKIEETRDNY